MYPLTNLPMKSSSLRRRCAVCESHGSPWQQRSRVKGARRLRARGPVRRDDRARRPARHAGRGAAAAARGARPRPHVRRCGLFVSIDLVLDRSMMSVLSTLTDDRRRHRAGQHRRPRRLRHADDAVLVECAAQPDLRGARLLRRRTASTSLSRCRSSPPTSSSSTTPILATTIERHQTIMENTCS